METIFLSTVGNSTSQKVLAERVEVTYEEDNKIYKHKPGAGYGTIFISSGGSSNKTNQHDAECITENDRRKQYLSVASKGSEAKKSEQNRCLQNKQCQNSYGFLQGCDKREKRRHREDYRPVEGEQEIKEDSEDHGQTITSI